MDRSEDQWRRLNEQKSNELREAGYEEALEIRDLTSLLDSLRLLSSQYHSKIFPSVITRLEPTLKHLESFTSAIGSALQNDETVSLVWGVLQAVLKAACLSSSNVLQNMTECIAELNDALPQPKSYVALFADSPELQHILQDIYDDYIDYFLEALNHIERSASGKQDNSTEITFLLLAQAVKFLRSLNFSSLQQSLVRTIGKIDSQVKDFHETARLVHRRLQQQQHEHIGKLLQSASLTVAAKDVRFPISTVSSFRNYTFYGREDVFDKINAAIKSSPGEQGDITVTTGPLCCVLYGLGGIGKSQIALEFSYRNRSEYDGIFWIQAELESTIKSTFASIADRLGLMGYLRGNESQDQGRAIERTREWLRSTDKRWLMIFDNVEDLGDLRKYLPESHNNTSSAVLITTQISNFPRITEHFEAIEVENLDRKTGAELLFRYMKRPAANDEEEETAQELSDILDGLPLALSTIGAYLNQADYSVKEYLEELKMSSNAWYCSSASQLKRYEKTLASVFEIAVKKLTPQARKLLDILAFLNPDAVPEELLVRSIGQPPLEFLKDRADMADAIGILRRRQLIKRDCSGAKPYISIHRTVQWNVLLDLSNDDQHRCNVFQQAFTLVRGSLPDVSSIDNPQPRLWSQLEKCVPQILSIRSHCLWPDPPVQMPVSFAQVLSDVATFMWHAGMVREGTQAMRTAEEILDDNHVGHKDPLRGNIHEHLAIFASFEGVSERGEAMERRYKAIDARKASLADIPKSRMTRENQIRRYNVESDLAFGYLQTEQFEECEKVIEKCNEQYKSWGTEDEYPFEYLKYNHIMSYVRMYQRRPLEAIEHCRKGALLGYEYAGVAHPITQLVKFSLGNHLYLAGELDEALKLNEDVLHYRIQACGRCNHFVLESHSMCGALLLKQGRFQKACTHLEQCLDRRKRASWNEEGVARAQLFYAQALEGLGKHEEARKHFEAARKVKDRYLKDYPEFVKPHENELVVFDQMVCMWSGRFTGKLQQPNNGLQEVAIVDLSPVQESFAPVRGGSSEPFQDSFGSMRVESNPSDHEQTHTMTLQLMPSKREAIRDHGRLLLTASQIRRTVHRLSYFATQSGAEAIRPLDYPSETALGPTLSKRFEDYLGTQQALFNGRSVGLKSDKEIDLPVLADCHRRMSRICLIIVYLQETGFLGSYLTVLVQRTRLTQVADLISLDIDRIAKLALAFDGVLEACLVSVPSVLERKLIEELNSQCNSLWRPAGTDQWREEASDKSTWYRAIDLLDLAVCLHCEAHCVPTVPSEAYAFPFVNDPKLHSILKLHSGWVCSTRKTSCLDEFFNNHELWICSLSENFEDRDSSNSLANNIPISIRTTILAFHIVWGPISTVEIDGSIVQYNTGRGCLTPWLQNEDEMNTQGVEYEARICHWMPFNLLEINSHTETEARDRAICPSRSAEEHIYEQCSRNVEPDDDSDIDDLSDIVEYADLQPCFMPIEELQSRAEYARSHPLDLDDILVIGARRQFDTGLQRTECLCSGRKFSKLAIDNDALRTLATRESVTSFTKGPVGFTFGTSMPGFAAHVKQDFTPMESHRYYKEVLMNEWQHSPDLCHPKYLQVRGGVIISRCTRNAIRCSILDLFSTPSVKRLIEELRSLKRSKFEDEPWWDVFLHQSSTEILRTWDMHSEWQSHMASIISICLTQLSYTGLDLARSVFNVLWMPPDGSRAKRLALDISRHDWLNTLCDGPETCAMAVLIEDSLSIQIDGHRKQFCTPRRRDPMRTVLQTAMAVSEELPPFAGQSLHQDHREPEFHQAKTGCHCYPLRLESGTFCAAPRKDFYRVDPLQRLMSVGSLSPDHLILQWWPSAMHDGANALLPNDLGGIGHREVFEDEEDALLVHIRHSRSPGCGSSKGVVKTKEKPVQRFGRWFY